MDEAVLVEAHHEGVEVLAGEGRSHHSAQVGDGHQAGGRAVALADLPHFRLELLVDHPRILPLPGHVQPPAMRQPPLTGDPTSGGPRVRHTEVSARQQFDEVPALPFRLPATLFRGVYTGRLSTKGTPMWLVYAIALILGGGIVLLQVVAGADHHIGHADGALDAHHAPTGPGILSTRSVTFALFA